ncbi:MAG: hypothetical protein WC238_02190 [Parcubacteria group bacterium]
MIRKIWMIAQDSVAIAKRGCHLNGMTNRPVKLRYPTSAVADIKINASIPK